MMNVRTRPWPWIAGCALLATVAAFPALSQEAAGEGLSVEEIPDAVHQHIEVQIAKYGVFWAFDPVEDESLKLKFVRMHDENYGHVGPMTYFASAEFEEPDGESVWLDFVMKGPDADSLQVLETTIQERHGKKRAVWHKEDYWKRETLDGGEAQGD